jgi:predicted deacetylase
MPARSWIVVSVHDVAPATRRASERWIDELERIGVPTSMLVVPGPWKGSAMSDDRWFGTWLRACQSHGHEICQHGWTHSATGLGSRGRRLVGRAVARGCAEFWTLEEAEAARRLTLGRTELRSEGIEPAGFIPPGWLASAGALGTMSALGYRYTTSHLAVTDFGTGARHRAVALSHRTGGSLERPGSAFMTRTARLLASQGRPVRIALHPDDVERPRLRSAALAAIDAAMTAGASAMTYLDVVNGPEKTAQVA